jgi:glucose-6-phosphate isomerase
MMPESCSESVEERIRLEIEDGERLVTGQIGPAHVAEVDEALRGIHRVFREEQRGGLKLLQERWRAWTVSHEQGSIIRQTVSVAERARRRFRAFVLLGVGGSDLAARLIHDCLDSPVHNLLLPRRRGGAPELHIAGDNFDPRPLRAILDSLRARGLLGKTLINVVSRSGTTAETLAAMMVVKQALEKAGARHWQGHCVLTTLRNRSSELYRMSRRSKREGSPFFGVLPVPEGVGGRFSACSPVGLFTLAMTANGRAMSPRERVDAALDGFCRGHKQCMDLPPEDPDNVAFRLARWLHLAEHYGGKTSIVLYNYANDRFLSDWVTQLYTESVQERGEGMNIIGTRGPTGNHSILNGIIRGPRDKIVVFIHWKTLAPYLAVPQGIGLSGDLADLEGVPLASIQEASYKGTAAEFTANGIPNVTLEMPRRDEAFVFQLLRTLMDTVAIKGRLQQLQCTASGALDYDGELTYQQDGVEGYKERMRRQLKDIRAELGLAAGPA